MLAAGETLASKKAWILCWLFAFLIAFERDVTVPPAGGSEKIVPSPHFCRRGSPSASCEAAFGKPCETMPWRAAKPVEEPAGTDATTMYYRMASWYNDAPESAALRTAWGAYPATPGELEAWPGFVAVTNAFLDHAGPPPTAPETVQFEEEGPPVSEEPHEPPLLTGEEREAPALSEEAVAEETGVVAAGPALSNKTLRKWVKRWCGGDHEGLPHISTWNTSQVTDMSKLFAVKLDWMKGVSHYDSYVLKTASFNDDISAWDTSNVTDMSWMFAHASSFNQPLNVWRVDKVTDMSGMFHCASGFNQPLNDWRVDNVTNMWDMFCGAKSFNQPLNDWRVDNVTSMRFMFCCASAFNQPLHTWRLRICCDTIQMLDADFQNSRPVKVLCCAIS